MIIETRDMESAKRLLTDPDLKDCSAVITYRIGYAQYNEVCVTVGDAALFLQKIDSIFYRISIGSQLDLLRRFVN